MAAAVRTAIEKGYRFIDCAYGYGNEAEIGASIETAIADKAVSREELFVLSKVLLFYSLNFLKSYSYVKLAMYICM